MATAYANVKPNNLTWARERAQMSISALALKLNVKADKVLAWENGQTKPTFAQAKKFAEQTLIPFGYLFLSQTPQEKLTIPDLRTVDGLHPSQPSAYLLKIVQMMSIRQQWYKEYLIEQGVVKNDVVGRFNHHSSVADIVADMKQTLNLGDHQNRGKWEDYERDLVKRIEDIGIMVMRQGDVGSSAKKLSVDEFRGFAICDTIAPLIFVNTADAPSAKLFTLIHELAHIWLGESGVSDASTNSHYQEEVLCNAVAAEFLVPEKLFRQHWQNSADWKDNLPHLEKLFRVSTYVLARRALTLGFIEQQQYYQYVMLLQKQWETRIKQGQGPNYYRTRKAQLSDNFAHAILSEALSNRVLLRDAGELLGVKPNNLKSLAKEYGI